MNVIVSPITTTEVITITTIATVLRGSVFVTTKLIIVFPLFVSSVTLFFVKICMFVYVTTFSAAVVAFIVIKSSPLSLTLDSPTFE